MTKKIIHVGFKERIHKMLDYEKLELGVTSKQAVVLHIVETYFKNKKELKIKYTDEEEE